MSLAGRLIAEKSRKLRVDSGEVLRAGGPDPWRKAESRILSCPSHRRNFTIVAMAFCPALGGLKGLQEQSAA
jgi:hypothetical protein